MTNFDLHNLITGNSDSAICIWWFNVDLDDDWNQQSSTFFPRAASTDKKAIWGMEQILLLLACENDFVIMRDYPNKLICDSMKTIGYNSPNILIPNNNYTEQKSMSELILSDEKLLTNLKNIAQNSNVYLIPYAITKHEMKISEVVGAKLIGPSFSLASWINSKINARAISKELGFSTTFGMECHSKEELSVASDIIQSKNSNCTMVLKDEYGASGKGLFIIRTKQDLDLVLFRAGKLDEKRTKYSTILENWYMVNESINYQILISHNTYLSKNYLVCVSRQDVKNGIYRGSTFIKTNTELYKTYSKYSIQLGDYLYEKGYRGICNIDSIITVDKLIIPIIEINGRLSLSTYISCISSMFAEDMDIVSAYYDINSKIELPQIYNSIEKYRYNIETKTGIFIYSFSIGSNRSRLFCLFAYPNINAINNVKLEFENILDGLKYII